MWALKDPYHLKRVWYLLDVFLLLRSGFFLRMTVIPCGSWTLLEGKYCNVPETFSVYNNLHETCILIAIKHNS